MIKEIEAQKNKNKIIIYTDGACSGNPGKGGWCAILMCETKNNQGEKKIFKKTISGGIKNTTNNQMELTAVIEALKIIKKSSKIEIFTDSKYVLNGFTEWLPNWIKNNWKTTNKKSVKNIELWKLLHELAVQHEIHWNWVKGHSLNEFNEEADRIAVLESKKQ